MIVASALTLLPAASASAHDFLVSSSPARGSTVTVPMSEVSLTFNDLVLDLSGDGSSAIVDVTGPDAQTTHYETGCPSILGRTVSAPVALGVAGDYVVTWQIVSSDGHPVSDSLSFTYAPPAGAVVAAGSASAPACGAFDGGGAGALQDGSSSAADSAAGWVILAIAGGIVVLAGVAVLVVVLLSRRPRMSSKKI